MGDTVIAARPPNDGREWDAQCARCGSSTEHVRCHACGGEADVWEEGSDDWSETHPCEECDGRGGWQSCLSDREWCETHPTAGREGVERGAVEWFVLAEDADDR